MINGHKITNIIGVNKMTLKKTSLRVRLKNITHNFQTSTIQNFSPWKLRFDDQSRPRCSPRNCSWKTLPRCPNPGSILKLSNNSKKGLPPWWFKTKLKSKRAGLVSRCSSHFGSVSMETRPLEKSMWFLQKGGKSDIPAFLFGEHDHPRCFIWSLKDSFTF